jgi:(S)-2-hydroxyglutarate dehydrogenase
VSEVFDYCVIGAGMVGLAVGYKLIEKYPNVSILIIEKENKIGQHQTSHNSGVIHAGIYYAPESLKARLCRQGLVETKAFCDHHDLAYESCGKLIVATNKVEEERVEQLFLRARNNGANVQLVGKTELSDLEPNVVGTLAIRSPETGIVDYSLIADKLKELLSGRVQITLNEAVVSLQEKTDLVAVSTTGKTYLARKLIACAGLQADRIARMAGLDLDYRIVPFRGEYFQLPRSKGNIVKHLIYPAPDPKLPFLGVHLTRMIDGSVTVGPNAVLGWAREGYKKYSADFGDVADFLKFRGFWKLIWKNRIHAMTELKNSMLKSAYLKECQKYCPSLELNDLLPYRAGIRAQVVSSDGVAVHDFLIKKTARMLHLINAPSPAATSALPIANMIVEESFL